MKSTSIKHLFVTCLFLFVTTITLGQNLKLTGEVRTRSIMDHGALGLASEDTDPGLATFMRSALYSDYTNGDITLHVSVQDTRSFNETNTANSNYDQLGIFQAFAKYNFNESTSIKVGRQMISYDDQRYLGGLRWLEQGRTFDAITLGIKGDKIEFTMPLVYAGQSEAAEPTSTSAIATFGNSVEFALFPHLKTNFDGGSISFLAAPMISSATNDLRYTLGTTGSASVGESGSKLGGSLYYQGGDRDNGLSSSGLQASVYGTAKAGKTSFTIGGEYMSGDDGSDDTDNRFLPDFGTNHKFNGLMDHFYVGAAPAVGLVDLHVKTNTKTGEKSNLIANAHYFLAAADTQPVYGTDASGFGGELDLILNLNMGSSTNFKFGGSTFIGATDTMEAFRGGSSDATQYWGWMMLTFKPTLFNTADFK